MIVVFGDWEIRENSKGELVIEHKNGTRVVLNNNGVIRIEKNGIRITATSNLAFLDIQKGKSGRLINISEILGNGSKIRSEKEIKEFYERVANRTCLGACMVWYDEDGCSAFTHGVFQALRWVLGEIDNILE